MPTPSTPPGTVTMANGNARLMFTPAAASAYVTVWFSAALRSCPNTLPTTVPTAAFSGTVNTRPAGRLGG